MRTYAVYRPLYGEDFIAESVLSIADYVDRIFFCYADKPLADVSEGCFQGQKFPFPLRPGKTMDQAFEKVEALGLGDKVVFHLQDGRDNVGQFTRLMNDFILPNYARPDIAFLIEPDHVMKKSEIKGALAEFKELNVPCATTKQVELWKTPDWSIGTRPRASTVFWNLNLVDRVPPTRRQADPVEGLLPTLEAVTHNFGFCVSWNAMFMKHVLALAFSARIGDSLPAEDWLIETWTKWDPLTRNRDLEISANHRHLVPCAVPYDRRLLPERIIEKYGYAMSC